MIKLFDPTKEINDETLTNIVSLLKPVKLNLRILGDRIRLSNNYKVKYKNVYYVEYVDSIELGLEVGEMCLLSLEPNDEELKLTSIPYSNYELTGAYIEDSTVYVDDKLILPYVIKRIGQLSEELPVLKVYNIKNIKSLDIEKFILIANNDMLWSVHLTELNLRTAGSYKSKHDLLIKHPDMHSVVNVNNNVDINNKVEVDGLVLSDELHYATFNCDRKVVVAGDDNYQMFSRYRRQRTRYVTASMEFDITLPNAKAPCSFRFKPCFGISNYPYEEPYNSRIAVKIDSNGKHTLLDNYPGTSMNYYIKVNGSTKFNKGLNDGKGVQFLHTINSSLGWHRYFGWGFDEPYDIELNAGDSLEIKGSVNLNTSSGEDDGIFWFIGVSTIWNLQEPEIYNDNCRIMYNYNNYSYVLDGKTYKNILTDDLLNQLDSNLTYNGVTVI